MKNVCLTEKNTKKSSLPYKYEIYSIEKSLISAYHKDFNCILPQLESQYIPYIALHKQYLSPHQKWLVPAYSKFELSRRNIIYICESVHKNERKSCSLILKTPS